MFKFSPSIRFFAGIAIGSAVFAQSGGASGLTLRQAMESALGNHLEVRLAEERVTESRARQGIARSALLPNLSGAAYQASVTSNLAAMGLSSSAFPGVPAFVGPFNRFDARVQLAQSVFNLASIHRLQESKEGTALASERRRAAEQQVIAGTALNYIAVLEARQSVEAAEANVVLSRRLLELAVNQRGAGIATGLDVVRAETRLAGQQVALEQAHTDLDSARLNLLRIIGAPMQGAPSLAETMKFEPAPARDAAAAIEEALAGRAELRVAAQELRVAQTERKLALAEWTPSVSVFGDYGSSGLKPNEVNLPTRTIGVRVDVPIFDGGRTRSAIQAASSRVRQAEMQLADLRAAVEKDVRLALDNLRTRQEQTRAARKTLELADRELSLAQDRFQNGVADNVELTGAQTALENARQAAVSSLAHYHVARLNLFAALGRAQDFSF